MPSVNVAYIFRGKKVALNVLYLKNLWCNLRRKRLHNLHHFYLELDSLC